MRYLAAVLAFAFMVSPVAAKAKPARHRETVKHKAPRAPKHKAPKHRNRTN